MLRHLGACCAYVGVMLGLCRGILGHVEPMLAPCWAYVEPILSQERCVPFCKTWYQGKKEHATQFLGHIGPMLGLCWGYVGPMLHVGPSWAHVGPMLGHVEPKFGN